MQQRHVDRGQYQSCWNDTTIFNRIANNAILQRQRSGYLDPSLYFWESNREADESWRNLLKFLYTTDTMPWEIELVTIKLFGNIISIDGVNEFIMMARTGSYPKDTLLKIQQNNQNITCNKLLSLPDDFVIDSQFR